MDTQINVRNPKLARTLARFKAKIAEGDFYEAHQTLRTIANRNVRSKAYDDAIDLLYHAAQILLRSAQPATGSDLTSYLVEVFVESETPVDAASKGKLIQLIQLFQSDEPSLKQVAIEITNWSIKFGNYPYGDPDLHHALGVKLAENGGALAYDAERHLLLGTSASVPVYTQLLWDWYCDDGNVHNFGIYCSRGVVQYLLVQNVKAANELLTTLLAKFIAAAAPPHSPVKEGDYTITVFDTCPQLNFLQLLLATITKADQGMYRRLLTRYSSEINNLEYQDAMALIGEVYFKIPIPKQTNLIADMMGSLFRGQQ